MSENLDDRRPPLVTVASDQVHSSRTGGKRQLHRLKTRAALTLLCAVAADGLQWLIPFLWPVFDAGMVAAVLILWGWRWEVLVVVVPELVPGLELAPTWTLFAIYLLVAARRRGFS